jgi:hypothetical protein
MKVSSIPFLVIVSSAKTRALFKLQIDFCADERRLEDEILVDEFSLMSSTSPTMAQYFHLSKMW